MWKVNRKYHFSAICFFFLLNPDGRSGSWPYHYTTSLVYWSSSLLNYLFKEVISALIDEATEEESRWCAHGRFRGQGGEDGVRREAFCLRVHVFLTKMVTKDEQKGRGIELCL